MISNKKRSISSKGHNTYDVNSIFDTMLLAQQEIQLDYKKQVSTLIPTRKPNNKKDYFVFGMSDRTNSSGSIL